MRRTLWIALTFILATVPAHADRLKGQDEESRYLSDRFHVELGTYSTDLSTDIAVGSGRILGTLIRLEDQLLVDDDRTTLWFSSGYRFNRRSSIHLAWTALDRDGLAAIDQSIDFEDTRFTGTVASKFDQDLVSIIYRYSFFNNGKMEAGVAAGISAYRFELALAGEAQLLDADGNPIGSTEFRVEDETVGLPVPVAGISLAYAIRKNTIFRWDSLLLDLEFDDIEGRLVQNRGTVDWYFHRNFGIGGGIQTSNIDVKLLNSSTPFTVDYRYSGFLFYITGVF